MAAPRFVNEKFFLVALKYVIVWLCQFGMRQCVSEETDKRMLCILLVYPFQSLVVNNPCGILRTLKIFAPEHRIFHIVFHHLAYYGSVTKSTRETVEEVWIIQVCLELADITVEFVNATLVGC